MKRLLLLSVFAFATVFMNSCGGGGIQADMKKTAGFLCEMKDLVAEGVEKNKEKLEKLGKEAKEFAEKMKKKYEGKEKDEKFAKQAAEAQKTMMKELEKCGLNQDKMVEFMTKLAKAGVNINM